MLFSLLLAFSLSLECAGHRSFLWSSQHPFSPVRPSSAHDRSLSHDGAVSFAGRRLAAVFPTHLAERFSPMLLLFFGVWLCLQGMGQGKRKETSPLPFPSLCDKNASSLIEPQEALLLGLLLSVDSFAIGLSAAAGGINVTLLPLFSALFQTFFLALGEKCGARLILSPAPKESLWSLLSGGILILLAVLQLLDKK